MAMNRVLDFPIRPRNPQFSRLWVCLTIATAVVAGACGSESTTSIVAPTEQKCQISVGQFTQSFTASGGTGQATISAARECSWTAASQAPWIALASPGEGTGSATLRFNVAANQVPQARSGALAVNDHQLRVAQEAAPCRFSVAPDARDLPAEGGEASVTVSTLGGCAWTASTTAPWIRLASGGGNGQGVLAFFAEVNTGAARTGTLVVAGQNVSVAQAAALPPTGPGPTPPPPGPGPAPTPVSLSGKVSGLAGDCPDLTFAVRGTRVVTRGSTVFVPQCRAIDKNAEVRVEGLREADGSVVATRVTVTDD